MFLGGDCSRPSRILTPKTAKQKISSEGALGTRTGEGAGGVRTAKGAAGARGKTSRAAEGAGGVRTAEGGAVARGKTVICANPRTSSLRIPGSSPRGLARDTTLCSKSRFCLGRLRRPQLFGRLRRLRRFGRQIFVEIVQC